MNHICQLPDADLPGIICLNIIQHGIQAFQLFLSPVTFPLRQNLHRVFPYQMRDELQQFSLADQAVSDFLLLKFLIYCRHNTVNHGILLNQRLEQDILVRQLLGEISHVENDYQHFHMTSVTVSRMGLVAVGNHQISLPGKDIPLV